MVAARWTQHPSVVPGCPVCGDALPPVVVDVDTRSDGGAVVQVSVSSQPLNDAWWDAAEQLHPTCGMRRAQQVYRAALS